MLKCKNLFRKLSRGAMTSVAALALMVTAANVSTCCWYILGQDELPENAKKAPQVLKGDVWDLSRK